MALMKTALKILLLLLTLSTNAQETPLRITDVQPLQPPQLKLHNGDFTSPRYTLSIPQPITAQPSVIIIFTTNANSALAATMPQAQLPLGKAEECLHQVP